MEYSPVLSRKLEKSALILGKIANLWVKFPIYRSSHRRCSVRKGVGRTFAKFTGKHLCRSLFLIKLQACQISKNSFFTEHLRATASVLKMQFLSFCRSFFLQGLFFLCWSWNVCQNALILRKIPCPHKFLVKRLYQMAYVHVTLWKNRFIN